MSFSAVHETVGEKCLIHYINMHPKISVKASVFNIFYQSSGKMTNKAGGIYEGQRSLKNKDNLLCENPHLVVDNGNYSKL